ncbi:MAG: M48 family metalloprotease [Pseudomonadota bacterium]|nr:M48 family metalloprotease [Pseudomonadota bacterium]
MVTATFFKNWSLVAVKVCRFFIVCVALACPLIAAAPKAYAQGRMHFIRDTEIENTVRVYVAPLFEAAGLDPNAVSILLVNDHNMNAFVAGGQKIFIHTGLLTRAESPGQVIGVLAHEIGHIAGGHLSQKKRKLENATAQSIIGTVLGGVIAVASNKPQGLIVGQAAGAALAQRSFLAYNRSMEQSADQAALKYLEATKQSAQGLYDFLTLLREQERIYSKGGNPYLRSHPMSEDRLRLVAEHLRNSRYTGTPTSDVLQSMHNRMRGKLKGFINSPDRTLREFSINSTDFGARMARAIALSKKQEADAAIDIVDDLIASSPKDPFLYDLKGDLLVDAGHTQDAVEPYQKAISILPWAALIKVSLAQIQLENSNIESQVRLARQNLKDALHYEPELTNAWRFLATAEGRLGNSGAASLALAEEALLRGKKTRALDLAKRAIKILPKGSPGWFRAQDIESATSKSE